MLDSVLQEIRERVNVTPYRGTATDARKLLDEVDRLRDLLRRAGCSYFVAVDRSAQARYEATLPELQDDD